MDANRSATTAALEWPATARGCQAHLDGTDHVHRFGQADTVPDDQSLVFNTSHGLVLLSGCGHSGIINTLQYARGFLRPAPVDAAIGGFHLFAANDQQLAWTASKLKEYQTARFLGAHCTGIESVYRLRELLGLTRQTCLVGTIGAVYDLNSGIKTGRIAQ